MLFTETETNSARLSPEKPNASPYHLLAGQLDGDALPAEVQQEPGVERRSTWQ